MKIIDCQVAYINFMDLDMNKTLMVIIKQWYIDIIWDIVLT